MDHSRDPYADIAEFYDIEHDALSEDIECYLALLALPGDGHGRVLEIGSGTGRIAAKLAAAGHTITGIEPSNAMRARCETRLAGLPDRVRRRVNILSGSATEPNLPSSERFDTVLIGLNTLAHLTTYEERQVAMRRAAAHLRPLGQLLVDVDILGPRKLSENAGLMWQQGHWPLPNTASYLTHVVSATPSEKPGVIDIHHIYDTYEQGGAVKRTTSIMPLALLSYGDLIGGLAHAGFSIDATYGGHDLAPFENDSPRLIVDARLAAN